MAGILATDDIAALLKVTPQTVQLWVAGGSLPAAATLADVRAFAEATCDFCPACRADGKLCPLCGSEYD